MKIGINTRYLQKQKSGIEYFLLNQLLGLEKIDSENEYTLFWGNDRPILDSFSKNNFKNHISTFPTSNQLFRVLWEHLYLPGALKREKIDVFHEPSFIAPLRKACKTVITVYDLAFIYHPECFTKRNVLYLKYMLGHSIRTSDAVIAISQSTKNDILNYYRIPEDKVKVVYGGTNTYYHQVKDKEKIDAIKNKYKINKNYILNVSLISPRKNLINLIKAYKILKDGKKADYQLVIAGGRGWLYDKIFDLTKDLGLQDYVVFTGYAQDEELLHLYNNALAFAYPSVYEGFGLPILEAMACGCPVVSSNTSSMPELCEDAAIMVDPAKVGEIADAIQKTITDGALRERCVRRGFEQIKKFNWGNTASKTLEIYKGLS